MFETLSEYKDFIPLIKKPQQRVTHQVELGLYELGGIVIGILLLLILYNLL